MTFHERQKLFIFFFQDISRKFLILLLSYFSIFLTANIIFICYFFSLIIMALPACTCEPGLRSVSLAQKISARCNTGSYVFSFFFICIFILLLALSHIYVFLFPQRVPSDLEVGHEKSILDEVNYCQTKREGDKYKFLLSQFVQWCSLVCSVKNAFNVKSRRPRQKN